MVCAAGADVFICWFASLQPRGVARRQDTMRLQVWSGATKRQAGIGVDRYFVRWVDVKIVKAMLGEHQIGYAP